MQITLTPEQEMHLAGVAAAEGKDKITVLHEILNRALAAVEADFVAAVQSGKEAADRGDFVDTAEVWARIERKLQS